MVPVESGIGDPDLDGRVKVKHTEEKGSDVNLAVHMLDDAWRDKIDRVLIVTNDGDLARQCNYSRCERGHRY
ncbi:MAG: NYN domain-containing protein [Proteobacteria bacterium]|nr:NYN domain-containing protein [Pseudomonadota bacterium]